MTDFCIATALAAAASGDDGLTAIVKLRDAPAPRLAHLATDARTALARLPGTPKTSR